MNRLLLLFLIFQLILPNYLHSSSHSLDQKSITAAFSEVLKMYGEGCYYKVVRFVNDNAELINNSSSTWRNQFYIYKYKSQWEVRNMAFNQYIQNNYEEAKDILSPVIYEINDSIMSNVCNTNSCKVWSSCMWLYGKANEKLNNYDEALTYLEQNHLYAKKNLSILLSANDLYKYTKTDYAAYWSDLALLYMAAGECEKSIELSLELLDYCTKECQDYLLSATEDVAYSYLKCNSFDKTQTAASYFIRVLDYMIEHSMVNDNSVRYLQSLFWASYCFSSLSDWNNTIELIKKYNLAFDIDNNQDLFNLFVQLIDIKASAYLGLKYSILGSLEEVIEENKDILHYFERKGETHTLQYAIRLEKVADLFKKKDVQSANEYFIKAFDVWDNYLDKNNMIEYRLLLDNYMCSISERSVNDADVKDIEGEIERYLSDLSSFDIDNQILLYNSQANYYGLRKNNFVKAEQLNRKALTLCINNLKSIIDNKLNLYVSVLSDAVSIQLNLGNWAKADSYSNELLNLLTKYEIKDATMAEALLNLALNYAYIGNNSKSEELRKEAYTIYLNNGYLYDANGSLNLELANSILPTYSSFDKIAKCKEFIEICNKEKRLFDLRVCELYTNYASSLSEETMYQDADSVFLLIDDSLNLYKDSLFEDYPNQYKYTISNLYKERALHEFRKGNFLNSAFFNEISDSISPNYLRNEDLAIAYSFANDQDRYEQNIIKALTELRSLINDHFSFLSDEERGLFFKNRTSIFQNWGGFAFLMPNSNIGLQCVYDAALLYKGTLLNTNREIQKIILSSDDKNVRNLYGELIEAKREASLNNNVDMEDVRIIEKKILNLLNIKNEYNDLNLTWKDVQQHLKVGECAVEFMKFDKSYWMHYNDSNYIDNHYVALVITPDSDSPSFVDLFDEIVLSKAIDLGSNLYRTEYGNNLVTMIWGHVEEKLQDVETIYFSPVGLLNLINIEALGRSNNKYIRLSSTREICKNDKVTFIDATFYGGLVYGSKDINQYDTQKEQLTRANDRWYSMTDTITRTNYGYLPGTLEEIIYSDKILRSNGLRTICYSGQLGDINSFRQLSGKSPSIIHIATHALWDNEIIDNGHLYYGGLLFSSAKDLDGTPLLHRDNYMSASEIATMDLTNTSLVILSACDTGVGRITDDGVFGIQRAFKLAGAKTIIMSLWKVDDAATSLMMKTFYDELFKADSKYDAFRRAQQIVREEFENPYYWASFIMLD